MTQQRTASATASGFHQLLEAAEFTLDLLDNLSTRQFAIGGDRPARLKLLAAIEKARGNTG